MRSPPKGYCKTDMGTTPSKSRKGLTDGYTHPFGISAPLRTATSSLPLDTALVDISKINGFAPLQGIATLIGLVPNTPVEPPVGTTRGDALHMAIPIISNSSAIDE